MAPSVVVSQPQQAHEEPARRVHADAAARMVGVTTDTIRRWVSQGLLPAERLGPGRRILVDPDDLERLFSSGSPTPVTVAKPITLTPSGASSDRHDPGEVAP